MSQNPDQNVPGSQTTDNRFPEVVEYNEFERSLVEQPRPIIENLLDDSSRMIFGGGSKTYKSWAMSEQAISIASGTPWWGFRTYQANVLYINFELKKYYAKYRFKVIRQFKKLNIPNGFLRIWNLRDWDVTGPNFESELIRIVQLYNILVIFIDPFYHLLGEKDERVSAELMPILKLFQRISKATSASIVCAAHFTKGNQAAKDPMDRVSGGASIHRHPDSLITLTRHQKAHAFTVDFISRDFPPIDPFVVEWRHPLLCRTDDNPEEIKQPGGRKERYDIELLYKFIEAHDDEFTRKEVVAQFMEESGWQQRTVYEKLTQLLEGDRVFISKATDKINIRRYKAKK